MSDKLPEFVKVRDLITGELSTVPSASLTPSMMPIPYQNQIVWIDREQLKVVKSDGEPLKPKDPE